MDFFRIYAIGTAFYGYKTPGTHPKPAESCIKNLNADFLIHRLYAQFKTVSYFCPLINSVWYYNYIHDYETY